MGKGRITLLAGIAAVTLFAGGCGSSSTPGAPPSAVPPTVGVSSTPQFRNGVLTDSGFALYVLSDIVFALGLAGTVPVALAAWTPTGICLIFGVPMLLHLEDG